MTLNKVVAKYPTKLCKASEGENSHPHRLVGESGADFVIPVPTGVTILAQGGTKLGMLLSSHS